MIDVHQLASALDCSERQIQLLTLIGMPKAGHGRYDLRACLQWHEQRQAKKARPWGSVAKQAAKERAGRRLLRSLRRELRALPSRVAPQLIGKNQAEIARILRGAVRELSAVLPNEKLANKGEN
jgi:hypothetical protein